MRKDILITANAKTSMIYLPQSRLGINGENLQGNLILKFEDEFIDGVAVIEIQRNNEKNYITMTKNEDNYSMPILSSMLNVVGIIEMEVRITESGNNIPVWKSNIFYLKVDEAINATTTIPEEYPTWIDTANAKILEIDEAINEVDNLNIDVNKSGTTTTVEITKKDGTTKIVNILDGEKGENGTDGQDGRDGTDGQDGADGITPTIGNNGNWYLGDSDTGKPSRGIQGENGIDGQDGYTPVKGIDYFTNEDISEIETDVKNDIKDINDLTNYELKTNTGSIIELSVNQSTYVVTINLKNSVGTTISTGSIDLPLESVVVSGSYNDSTKKIILTLQSGNTIEFSVADLVSGLQSEITSSNKLSSDLIDDTNNTNKFVTSQEKITWNNKSDFSGSYNDLTNKPTIPSALSDLSDDSTHRLVSDSEKTIWNGKQNELTAGTNISISNENVISATDTTYDNATTETAGLMSSSDKTKLNGIASGAGVNVQANWNETDSSSDSYIQNKPAIPTVPTNVSAFTNDAGYTTNAGTITGITMNGTSKGTSGTVDLGTVITEHQDISGKENISNKVTSLSANSTDTQYPSAKCVYDLVGNISTVLASLVTVGGGE